MCLAIPGKITSITDEGEMTRRGSVDFSGVTKEISLAFVPEAKVGDHVLVHVGFAISTIDETEAQEIFRMLAEMDELGELEDSAT